MHDLSSTTGIVALAAGGVAIVTLLFAIVLAVKLRKLRRAQRVVLGDSGAQDLAAHATSLQGSFADLHAYVEDIAAALHGRMEDAERRLEGTLAYRSLVRYDAYNEMSGRQSTTIALLDASRSGVVLSSIHHREQARLYAKQLIDGRPELELSPEESEAVRIALSSDQAARRE
jgi:Protein of unknown function (DUF4446)